MENQTNVYQKLNACRMAFKSAKVKKSGKNTFAGYDYFELDDILNAIIPICSDNNCTTIVNFSAEAATLAFTDCDSGNSIVFTSPMSTASLKGCHDVQNLGAVESYIKRYLYQNCFEIAEPDMCDRTMNPNDRPVSRKPKSNTDLNDRVEPSEETKSKNFEAFVVKYSNVNAKATMAILKAHGYNTPNEVPAGKRNDVANEIKDKIQL